jgi:rod shape-determining protein MreB and related proteins
LWPCGISGAELVFDELHRRVEDLIKSEERIFPFGQFWVDQQKNTMFWPFRTSSSIGVDLGTANTLMYVSGKGIVLDEPSVVALDLERGIPLEVGEGAKRMIGKTPKSIQAIRPLRDGVIADYAAAELMIQTFMRRGNAGKSTAPRMVVGIPSSITDVERRAVREAGITGSKEVYLIDETVAAAIGAGLPITEPVGSMIVDIGGGTTDVAVLSLGSPVESESIRIAGDEITESIADYLKKTYGLVIGEATAEKVKISIGSAHANARNDDRHMEVSGFNNRTGLPESITVTAGEIREAIQQPLGAIVDTIKRVLENTPPELAADVHARGIVLAGGGALIPGISDLITESTGIFTIVADDPLHCVVNGCGQVVDDWQNLKRCTSADA